MQIETTHPSSRDVLVNFEHLLGYTIVTDAPWLDWGEWDRSTVISRCGQRVRLVALAAKQPGQGAFTRLIERITEAQLIPIIVAPFSQLEDWCKRHDYRSRIIGTGSLRHVVWYPRLCLKFKRV